MEKRVFLEEDWYTKPDCPLIEDYILEDSNNFVSFMYQLAITIIGSEEQLLQYIGVQEPLW
jgi:hypothetical protein